MEVKVSKELNQCYQNIITFESMFSRARVLSTISPFFWTAVVVIRNRLLQTNGSPIPQYGWQVSSFLSKLFKHTIVLIW